MRICLQLDDDDGDNYFEPTKQARHKARLPVVMETFAHPARDSE